MKRQGLVAAAVLLAVIVAVVLVLQRGRHDGASQPGGTTGERVFVSDSLGVRVRLPDSAGWTLRREPPGLPDGRIVSAVHESDRAGVRVLILPATSDTKLEEVFEGRKKQLAPIFGVDDLDKTIAQVIRDETRQIGGHVFKQWQGRTHPIEVPGEPSAEVVFLWLMTVDSNRSIECLGLVRFPSKRTPEEQAASEALLHDTIYILQSFEVR
jgi:hypothetical protein